MRFFKLSLGLVLASSAFGQHIISAQSGLIHYTEGQVFLGDDPVKQKLGEYPDVKPGQHLRTETGRAEVLLTPGVFLRLSENSEIVMVSTALTNTQIEVVKGAILLEADELEKEHRIELTVDGRVLEVRKRGTFRVDAGSPPRVRVFDGEVTVVEVGNQLTVKEGKQVLLTSAPVIEKFSKEDTDAFYRWAGRRSGYLALANMSATRRMSGTYLSAYRGGWYFDPYFGMYTYIPNGRYTNAWRHSYYPPTVHRPLPPSMIDGMGGMSASRGGYDSSGRGYSGGGSSGGGGGYQAPATSGGGSAAGGGAPRSGDSGSSREGRGGSR
jgi:hypothetical protein